MPDVLATESRIAHPSVTHGYVRMLNPRNFLLQIMLIGLSLNPIYALTMASMNDAEIYQSTQTAHSQSNVPEHTHCHPETGDHHTPACCKAGQCDCHPTCVVAVSGLAPIVSYDRARVITGISSGLHPTSTARFFRPPIH